MFIYLLVLVVSYAVFSWLGLHEEMKLDMQRIWKRNLGRDDRCIADNGKEVLLTSWTKQFLTSLTGHMWQLSNSSFSAFLKRLDFLSWMKMLYGLCLIFLCGRLPTLINLVESVIKRFWERSVLYLLLSYILCRALTYETWYRHRNTVMYMFLNIYIYHLGMCRHTCMFCKSICFWVLCMIFTFVLYNA